MFQPAKCLQDAIPSAGFGYFPAYKGFSGNVFIQFNVAVADPLHKGVVHGWNTLTVLALKSMVHQPLSNKFLAQLFLRDPVFLVILIAFGVKIPG